MLKPIIVSALMIGISIPASAAGYGPHLEGFAYPYPTVKFELTTQWQSLSMNYMDVAPTGKANGRTVVLLHGKNFCGATWDGTIKA
ncbi:MAG: alpha/beta hydrolase, partial [Pseudomonadales bacterium 32-61-5]